MELQERSRLRTVIINSDNCENKKYFCTNNRHTVYSNNNFYDNFRQISSVVR